MTTTSPRYFTGLALALAACSSAHAGPTQNKDLVKAALTELFVQHDASAVERYWGESYTQHNPVFPNGREVLVSFAQNFPAGFTYEMGMVAADGDLVMVHSRYSGTGPKPSIVVDIFRVKDGKIVEHWDVGQDEVPASATASGNPMFTPGE